MATVQEVLTLIHELSDAERDELLDRLFTEDDEDDEIGLSPAQAQEIHDRFAAHDRGEMESVPWEQVRADLWKRLGIPD